MFLAAMHVGDNYQILLVYAGKDTASQFFNITIPELARYSAVA
jgi:hypothetical protein